MLWIEEKYVGLISHRLRNFKRKLQYLWNFSCPFCGDSVRRKHAARGYIYHKNDHLNYCCHKCGIGMSLGNFVAQLDPVLHREMQLEYFKPRTRQPKDATPVFERPVFDKNVNPFHWLRKISELSKDHPCRSYVAGRHIPEAAFDDLYFTPEFYTWSGRVVPGRYKVPKDARDDESRLVIPFRNRKSEITAFQGRALNGQEPKYVYVALTKDEPLIWGLDKIILDKTIYVFEGPLDAMFVPNSLACGGGDISADLLRLQIPIEKFVIVYDNEPRKVSTVEKIEKAINRGFSVCIWPNIEGSDVNEMIEKQIKFGLETAQKYVFTRIETGTYSGISAKLALKQWSRIDNARETKHYSRGRPLTSRDR